MMNKFKIINSKTNLNDQNSKRTLNVKFQMSNDKSMSNDKCQMSNYKIFGIWILDLI